MSCLSVASANGPASDPEAGASGQLEYRHRFDETLRLLPEALGGRCAFLDKRSILLRDLVHLRDGLPDLRDAGTLFDAQLR